MNSNKQWIRDPEHPTIWILNPNFRPSEGEPPSMQIQPIEEPIIQLPVELPHVELPQVEPPSMQIQPIHDLIIQLSVELPQVAPPKQIQPIDDPIIQLPVELPQVAPPKQIQPITDPVKHLPVEVPQVTLPPPTPIQPIADPVQAALFHPGFFCVGAAHCPHFSHQTQIPTRSAPSSNIVVVPVTPN